MSVRIEKRVEVGGSPSVVRVVSVEVPDCSDALTVAVAASKLEDVAEKLAKLSPCCFVPLGHYHAPGCPKIAHREDWIELLYQRAIEDGMTP